MQNARLLLSIAGLVLVIVAVAYHLHGERSLPIPETNLPLVYDQIVPAADALESVQEQSCSDGEIAAYDPIAVRASPLGGDIGPDIGSLIYRGGVDLNSESERFGGVSGLEVFGDGESVSAFAVSDEALLLKFDLTLSASGELEGIADTSATTLVSSDGQLLAGKAYGDSESLALDRFGGLAIGFEQKHRIGYVFPDLCGAASRVVVPQDLIGAVEALPDNKGLEALAYASKLDDSLIFGVEQPFENINPVSATTLYNYGVINLTRGALDANGLESPSGYGLVGMDVLETGMASHLFMLQRAYDPATGNRLRVLKRTLSQDGDPLAGPTELLATLSRDNFTVDNFEGISVVETETGVARIYLVSDDNFSDRQRTLLVAFDHKLSQP